MVISWNKDTHWLKKVFDLHNIVGVYVFLFALVMALSGLVWGFQWFAQGLYKMAGGQKLLIFRDPGSIITGIEPGTIISPVDSVWVFMNKEYPEAKV
jgi:uncharacterized iron-regulated membrane protein